MECTIKRRNWRKAEKISSKFSNCAITQDKKKLVDFTQEEPYSVSDVYVSLSLSRCVCVNKLNKCRVAFCLTAVFLFGLFGSYSRCTAEHCQSKELKPHKHKISCACFATFTYDFLQHSNQQFGHFVCHVAFVFSLSLLVNLRTCTQKCI